MAVDSVLIVSTNWIGDAVMGMPALQCFRRENPESKITVLTKLGLKALWEMHPNIDDVLIMGKPIPTARKLRGMHFDRSYIFPNSLRSAFVPWLAGVPNRRGFRGHWRHLLLNEIITPPDGHQQYEYKAILGVEGELSAPQLNVPDKSTKAIIEKLSGYGVDDNAPLITLLPGAARGPSKRWPTEHFIELAKKLRSSAGASVILGGGPDDAVACDDIAAAAGEGVFNLAGKTTVPEWSALLKISDCVVSNDSGGMHLATAVESPVVGIFGITDPEKTGPLGKSKVLKKGTLSNRNIARSSEEAAGALGSITSNEVYEAVCGLLED